MADKASAIQRSKVKIAERNRGKAFDRSLESQDCVARKGEASKRACQ